MYEFILKKYKDAMVKWTKGTGGGPGAPEGYENWETRNDEWFQNYASGIEFIPWLTWVYCMDQENGSLLLSKYEGLPSGIGTEDAQSLSSAATSAKSSKQGNMIGAVTEVLKGMQDEIKNMYRDTVHEQLSLLRTLSTNNDDNNKYVLNDQFEKAHETYVNMTMSIINEAETLHPFQLSSMKRKRNDCHTLMKKLKIELQKHGIEKTIEEYPDELLPEKASTTN